MTLLWVADMDVGVSCEQDAETTKPKDDGGLDHTFGVYMPESKAWLKMAQNNSAGFSVSYHAERALSDSTERLAALMAGAMHLWR